MNPPNSFKSKQLPQTESLLSLNDVEENSQKLLVGMLIILATI